MDIIVVVAQDGLSCRVFRSEAGQVVEVTDQYELRRCALDVGDPDAVVVGFHVGQRVPRTSDPYQEGREEHDDGDAPVLEPWD